LSPAQTTPSSILTGALTKVFGDDRNAARWADKIDQLVNVAQPLYDIGQNFGQSAKSFLSGQYGQGAAQAGSGLMGAAMMDLPVPPPLKEEGVLAAERILPKIIPDSSSVLAARPEEIARQAASAKFMEGSNAPPVMYHGTNADRMSQFTDSNQNAVLTDEFGNKTIKQFAGTRGNPGAPVVGYAAFDPDFAADFAGFNKAINPEESAKRDLANSQVSVYPVNVRATNIFDIANPEHRQMVGAEKADQSFLSKITPNFMHPWNWRDLEYNSNKIKNAGFDSYYDYENGINKSKTGIGVFDPRQIKSTFARRFDPEHPDIGEKRGGYITKAEGGYIHDPARHIRKALMIAKADGGDIDGAAPVPAPAAKGPKTVFAYGRPSISETKNPKRIMFTSDAPGKVKGIVTPRHMWEGGNGKGGIHIPGMEEINEARANVYGSENRPPLTVGKMADIHQNTLAEHFQKPVQQQMADESAALGRLRAAMHIGKTANTLDKSEKLDTVRHEYDDQGRTYLAYGAKGTAGHTVYTSGAGDNRKFHVVNTCAGQTGGCGGGVDKNGIVDTSKGACFAPNAEGQYVGAAVRRAAHEQAKFDPAMTQDWVLAHTGSLRAAANNSDRSNKVTLFRPNIVDETDRSTRHVIRGLNKQRIAEGKPAIIANSYGKTAELHDPENGYFVTYSNTGPKTKLGASIAENISRDKSRVHATVMANEASGKDYVNEDGNLTPPKNSYAVTDVQRGSDLDKRMQGAFTHVKYWTAGRDEKSLSPEEINEGAEGHYDGSGNPTTPVKSHYGHSTLNGMRYDYQRQHILHPRLVHVGKNKDGSPHMIPTDSRFKDDDYLPKNRFMTKNGKQAGAILLTTPTTSTSSIGHQSSFTHHVDNSNISHALDNNGEYEIDPPAQQQASAGNEYEPPKGKETYAHGGFVTHDENGDLLTGFPEQSFLAQKHNSHRLENKSNEEADAHRTNLYKGLKAVPSLKITPEMRETISKGLPRKTGGFVPPARSSAVEQALKLTSKSGATLPAAVDLARQLKPGRR